jgi:hypothetical protein
LAGIEILSLKFLAFFLSPFRRYKNYRKSEDFGSPRFYRDLNLDNNKTEDIEEYPDLK